MYFLLLNLEDKHGLLKNYGWMNNLIYNVCFILIHFFYYKQKLTASCTELLKVWKFPKLGSNREPPIHEDSFMIKNELGTMDFENLPI